MICETLLWSQKYRMTFGCGWSRASLRKSVIFFGIVAYVAERTNHPTRNGWIGQRLSNFLGASRECTIIRILPSILSVQNCSSGWKRCSLFAMSFEILQNTQQFLLCSISTLRWRDRLNKMFFSEMLFDTSSFCHKIYGFLSFHNQQQNTFYCLRCAKMKT
jgi:hypothetical protein